MCDFAPGVGDNNEKNYQPCGCCGQWKVIVWLHMCGRCAIQHRRRTAESVALWKIEFEAMKRRKEQEAAMEKKSHCTAVRHCEHEVCCYCKALDQIIIDCRAQGFSEEALQEMKNKLLRRAA